MSTKKDYIEKANCLKYFELIATLKSIRTHPKVSLEDMANLIVRIMPQKDLAKLVSYLEEMELGKYGKKNN